MADPDIAAAPRDLWDAIWEIQDVLQEATIGNYDARCRSSIEAFGTNPLTTLTPAINLLLEDVKARQQKQERTEAKLKATVEELEAKLRTIEEQAAAIKELSTPVMEIWEDVLVLPIVGVLDTRRSLDIMTALLQTIVERQAKCVIVDITGVEIVDTKTADYLLKVIRAAILLGARPVLTGLRPAFAQTLVEIGADLGEVRTLRSLKDGLKDSLRFLREQKSGPDLD